MESVLLLIRRKKAVSTNLTAKNKICVGCGAASKTGVCAVLQALCTYPRQAWAMNNLFRILCYQLPSIFWQSLFSQAMLVAVTSHWPASLQECPGAITPTTVMIRACD